jgi:hypothetical protein
MQTGLGDDAPPVPARLIVRNELIVRRSCGCASAEQSGQGQANA